MKLSDLLTEMPIGDLELIGNFDKGHSMRGAVNRKILTNPKAIEKVRNKFANCPFDFDLYFVNLPEAAGEEFTEVGQVSMAWLKEKLPNTHAHLWSLAATERTKFPNDDAITVIFTNNEGAARVPLTAWIMAHRIGHVIDTADNRGPTGSREEGSSYGMQGQLGKTHHDDFVTALTGRLLARCYGYQQVAQSARKLNHDMELEPDRGSGYGGYSRQKQYYNNGREKGVPDRNMNRKLTYRRFWEEIDTFKSARDKNLRNENEFYEELFAQYITTGTIRFNPPPKIVPIGAVWGRPGPLSLYLRNSAEAENLLTQMAWQIENGISGVLAHCIGSIFVM